MNPACAKGFACGENTCTAQTRRRPEGRIFKILIDLAFTPEQSKLCSGAF